MLRPPAVRFRYEVPASMARVHVVIRLALLVALGAVGSSSVYWVVYVALPAFAALVVAQKGAERYLAEDGPSITRVLRWVARAYAYLWMLTDEAPSSDERGPVQVDVDAGGRPTPGAAIARLITSLPALVVLAVFSIAAWVVWVVAAIAILITKRMPNFCADVLAFTLAYEMQLVAYHLSLVDRYPSIETAAPRASGPSPA